eukprot:GHRR01005338.1.p1 GENE.GHRR01005338.1~~GHRR01005338.1.p1  ORF type:complete len:121 (+),score=2.39 GHRR01005338.1:121-483(+)
MAAPSKATTTLAHRLSAFINSPTGPKTTHFWGPVANWGFVVAVRIDGHSTPNNSAHAVPPADLIMFHRPILIGLGRHEEDPRSYITKHDHCYVHLQLPVHEVCLDGAAAQLFAACLPCKQ